MDGVVVLDKPKGITSHTAVQIIKRLYGARKAGHTGTLDPIATGVLPVCINRATKLADELMSGDKEYEVEIVLGTTTTTYDTEGEVVGRSDVPADIMNKINKLLPEFTGVIEQKPPYFSAVKHKGRPLYKWAREGKLIDVPPRRVEIKKFEIMESPLSLRGACHSRGSGNPVTATIKARIVCSKGTYIRSICHDLGKHLGIGACMGNLRRISTGRFRIEDSVSLGQLESCKDEADLRKYIVSISFLS